MNIIPFNNPLVLMSLIAGARLGPYEIQNLLGAGGMGEVYRARDTKLGRGVAVKVLPESLASDPDRVARFEREAKVLASLNHPHIAALYGMEEADRRHFLVMELVEGETLADRLRRGPIPVEDSLRIAHQIAEALEAAHEKGVVHRDLKPANVKITPDERVKVLDFGLAKAMEPAVGSAKASPYGLSMSPTITTSAMTQTGMILGTAAYMSPEQAQGLAVDHRSDVFSFGSVLYEMLTGRQLFQGGTTAALIASVLVGEPDLTALPPNLNPRLSDLIRRCLEKNPKRRWQAVGDLRAEIETVAAAPRAVPGGAVVSTPAKPLWKRAIPVAVTAILVGALGVFAGRTMRSPDSPTVARFPISLDEGQRFTAAGRRMVAISPDGTRIVYVANTRLYLRSISELEARPIPGTDARAVTSPAFSPDGQSIAFYSDADMTLKRIAVSGGTAVTICPAENPYGVSWDADGIVFGQGRNGILRVSPDGGKPELLASVTSNEVADAPQIMPGGHAVLFTIGSRSSSSYPQWDKAQVVVQDLSSMERTVVIDGASDAHYVPTGHLVYAVGGVLFAVPFDERRRRVTGGSVPVVEGVRRTTPTGTAHFAFSNTGSLVYVPGPASALSLDLAWAGRESGIAPMKLPARPYEFPRISPDGAHVAVGTDDGRDANVWIHDVTGTASMRQLTFGGRNRFPIWSTDGQRIAFQSDREGDLAIFWQRADGTGTAERLTRPEPGASHIPESWAPKSDRFLFSERKGPSISLWTSAVQDKRPTPVDIGPADAPPRAAFSPDGRWVAYAVVKNASFTLFVEPFPTTGAKNVIAPGFHPLWSPDGKELFFSRPGPGQTMVVRIATEPSLTFGNPEPVLRAAAIDADQGQARNYDITPDGQRFITVVRPQQTPSGSPASEQLQVVLNWFEELKARVPTR